MAIEIGKVPQVDKAALDIMYSKAGSAPLPENAKHVLGVNLAAACHDRGVDALYTGDGMVRLICHACKASVLNIVVMRGTDVAA